MSAATREVVSKVWLCRDNPPTGVHVAIKCPEFTVGYPWGTPCWNGVLQRSRDPMSAEGHVLNPTAPSENKHRKEHQCCVQEDLTKWRMGRVKHIQKSLSCSNSFHQSLGIRTSASSIRNLGQPVDGSWQAAGITQHSSDSEVQ